MLSRHTNELYRRLERVADRGTAEIQAAEIKRWYNQERITVNIWRDMEDKWHDIDPDHPLLVAEAGEFFVFAYGQGLTCSDDAWFKPLHPLTKRVGVEDL
jgi:hypothetical protein